MVEVHSHGRVSDIQRQRNDIECQGLRFNFKPPIGTLAKSEHPLVFNHVYYSKVKLFLLRSDLSEKI